MSNIQINPFVFRKYDIRGNVANDFPPEVVELLGKGYGTYLRRKGSQTCNISGDVRLTTDTLVDAFTKGLLSTGINVTDLGKLPTPVNYYSTYAMEVDAAVMVTGSHNPPEFNGFKLTHKRAPVFADEIVHIKKIIDERDFETGSGKSGQYDIREQYLDMLGEKIQLNNPVRMVLDCGNGAGALLWDEACKRMGIDAIPLFCEPDGRFPNHHPDPTIEKNLQHLIAKVQSETCQAGVALDGDADRIGAVDENGKIFWADILMALFIPELAQNRKPENVVFDVKCSQALEEVIIKHGFTPDMTPTGHSILKQKMKKLGIGFAGELSGHIFFADEFFGFDDAIYNTGRLARLLDRSGKKLSELVAEVPHYYSSPEVRVTCQDDENKFRIAKEAGDFFRSKYDCVEVDGVRIKFGDGWALARASHTQPDITCRFEAQSEERLEEITALVVGKLKELGAG